MSFSTTRSAQVKDFVGRVDEDMEPGLANGASPAPKQEFLDAEDIAHDLEVGANRQRITTKFMTKYERARILGTRALQIRSVPCTLLFTWVAPQPNDILRSCLGWAARTGLLPGESQGFLFSGV